MDKHPDLLSKKFTEKRIKSTNSSEPLGLENFHPFLIEPLRAALPPVSCKQTSNTGSESVVTSPQVILPEMPIISK